MSFRIIFGLYWTNLAIVIYPITTWKTLTFSIWPNLTVHTVISAVLDAWLVCLTLSTFFAWPFYSIVSRNTSTIISLPNFISGTSWFTIFVFCIIYLILSTTSTLLSNQYQRSLTRASISIKYLITFTIHVASPC